jgi:putative SOS response-associated peptidase YedK
MCGRAYSTYTDEELELRYLSSRPIHLRLAPTYNLAPTQMSPVVRMRDGERRIEMSKWGLVAFKPRSDEKSTLAPINARSETIDEKPMFKSSFLKRRCVVPVSGFYEWKKTGTDKQPYAIHGTKEPILSFAGIYNEIELEGGEILDTFTILTTTPNSDVEAIHDRMPVILSREDEEIWLNSNSKISDLKRLFEPAPRGTLSNYPVSTAVNSPRNNGPELLKEVKTP